MTPAVACQLSEPVVVLGSPMDEEVLGANYAIGRKLETARMG